MCSEDICSKFFRTAFSGGRCTIDVFVRSGTVPKLMMPKFMRASECHTTRWPMIGRRKKDCRPRCPTIHPFQRFAVNESNFYADRLADIVDVYRLVSW